MVMDNSSEIFAVSTVRQPQTIANDMMRGFVQTSQIDRPNKRKAEPIKATQKRINKKPKDIRSFFN